MSSVSDDTESSSHFVTPASDVRLSATQQALAGSTAKGATKLILYPLDTFKSRRQARRFGELQEFRHLQTLRGVYRGIVPKLLLYSPYQAVYMSAYITARDHLLQGPLGDSVATFAVAGAVAEVAGSAIRLPMEVAKLRLQLGAYSNSFQAFKDILMNPWRLTRGFVPQTIMHDCSYSACGWLFFESGRQWLYSLRGSSNLPVYENLLLGFAAGTLTSLVTNPFDVIKTRIIGSSSETPPGILSTAKSIWRFEGLGAFWQGASLRVLHLAPSHGLYMLLYEVIKLQIAAFGADEDRKKMQR
ncbi:unnamed protein product [Durusdinium trenchii]|uniref:Mitochondrial carrier n=1 Tax=Durusdinium trenchii TaxID=1381693 RepID=A0ABP0I6C2_9DINO